MLLAGLKSPVFFLLVLSSLFFSPSFARALQPSELLLIVNDNSSESLDLARYYQQQRKIPKQNLLQVNLPKKEDLSREQYLEQLITPLRAFLKRRTADQPIRCLVLFYGLPLRVGPPELSHREWQQLEELKFKKKEIDWQFKNSSAKGQEEKDLRQASNELGKKIEAFSRKNQSASVDSELALALNDNYHLENWLPNPFFIGFLQQQARLKFKKDQVLWVARLDGPDPVTVRRIIDDSLRAEQQGLSGKAYFDARWPMPDKSNLQGYALYDASLHKAAEEARKSSRLSVILDQQERLFQPGEAPEAAIYCGWYSLAKYVDAFDWQPGAVAFHIASSECTTLKKPGSQVWCKRLLEDGVAATIGPVAEPYVTGFPLPEVFFHYLLDGYYTLAESYFLSLPYLSWQMVLIGDPLYRPFRNYPKL